MSARIAQAFIGLGLLLAAASAMAANLVIYDDQSVNGFEQGCSFPSPSSKFDFANTTPVHGGTHSIRFTPDTYNAVSWCTPATYSVPAQFTGLDFWVHGGTTGGQNVYVVLGHDGSGVKSASLAALNGGNPVPAANWVHIQASFAAGALAYSGPFDQLSLQDGSGGAQADMYFDDVSLTSAAVAPGQNYIFSTSFEPEYMFVPQYSNFDGTQGAGNSIKVYQRIGAGSDIVFVRETVLGQPGGAAQLLRPNAVAFDPDGGLWVVDEKNSMLWRYTLDSIVTGVGATPTTHVGPTGKGGLYDLAFFGDFAYASSDSGILKYPTADMASGNNPAPTTFSSNGLPVGLAFDAQGRLWICNYGAPGSLVRMSNTNTGHIDVTLTGAVFDNAEGLSFDEYGGLWVADNNEPTLYGFGSWQIAADGSPAPTGQINLPTPAEAPVSSHPSGFAGGIRFDRHGDVRIGYEYNYSVLGYTLKATPHAGGGYEAYTSSALSPLSNATSDPGRGGIAIWPLPSTVHQ